jgi:hypothetical protein
MQTTTFQQVIGSESFAITLPVTRVTTIMDKVDALIEANAPDKAKKVLAPFMNQANKPVVLKGNKKEDAITLISVMKAANKTRTEMIKGLQHDMCMSYANARHYVVNVSGL